MNNTAARFAALLDLLNGVSAFRPRLILPIAADAVALLTLLPGGPAQAQTPPVIKVPLDWSLIPTGLVEGDQFRLIFVSSTSRNASSTDIDVYNTWIQNLFSSSGHEDLRRYASHFRVVGCTAAAAARDNTGTTYTDDDKGVPIYWLGGSKVADDYSDFYDATWDDEANPKNESGSGRPIQFGVWTGCGDAGTSLGGNYLGDSRGVSSGTLNQTLENRNPLGVLTEDYTGNKPMYGLSPVFEVTPPPYMDLTLGNQKGWALEEGMAQYRNFDVTGPFDVTITFSRPVSGFDKGDVRVAYINVDGLDEGPYPSVGLTSLTEVTAGTEYRGRVDRLLDGWLHVQVEGEPSPGITATDDGQVLAVKREEDGVTVNTAILQFNVDAPPPPGPSSAAAVWSSTMTVGEEGGYRGYAEENPSTGSLSESGTFTIGETEYTVEEVLLNPYSGRLFLRVSSPLPNNGRDITLNVGDRGFRLRDATTVSQGVLYTWVPYAPGWSAGDTVEVSLRPAGGV